MRCSCWSTQRSAHAPAAPQRVSPCTVLLLPLLLLLYCCCCCSNCCSLGSGISIKQHRLRCMQGALPLLCFALSVLKLSGQHQLSASTTCSCCARCLQNFSELRWLRYSCLLHCSYYLFLLQEPCYCDSCCCQLSDHVGYVLVTRLSNGFCATTAAAAAAALLAMSSRGMLMLCDC
jgi:hypothetical protein